MGNSDQTFRKFDAITHQVIQSWYERVKQNYVTDKDGRDLGIEPELKVFHQQGSHRIKFSRNAELDVTYGLGVRLSEEGILIESSVNNKSEGFDYEAFMDALKAHYWRSRDDKPWIDPEFDRFSYQDLLPFDPVMGHSVTLDTLKDKADIIRLNFRVSSLHLELLVRRQDVLGDLVDEYCLAPLKRIYAETFHSS